MFTELFTELPGQTLFAFPEGASFPLSGWLANRVAVTEPLSGLYSATLDDSIAENWLVFVGSAQPANHFAAIYRLSKPQEAGSGSVLTGANVVTITVQLNSQPVQGAKVRLARVGEAEVRETNASGQVVFSADNGNWSVSITKPGLSFTPVTLVVDGTENVTYSMVELVPSTPSDPGKRTVTYTCINSLGVAAQGLAVTCKLLKAPGVGIAAEGSGVTVLSNSTGVVEFPNRLIGATYEFSIEGGKKIQAVIPPGVNAVALESIAGK